VNISINFQIYEDVYCTIKNDSKILIMRGIHYFFRISCHPCYASLTGGTFGEIQITDVTYGLYTAVRYEVIFE